MPDHTEEWYVIRLLDLAATDEGGINYWSTKQLKLIRKHVTLPQYMLDAYTPPKPLGVLGYHRYPQAA